MQMRIWTIQPVEVLDILDKNGIYVCDTEKSENYEDFREAYLWLVKEMDKRNIPHPDGLELPLWAWHTSNWKHKKPNLHRLSWGTKGKKYACIELEISEDKVLLSDFDAWHFVLNKMWLNNSKSEGEWEALYEWYETLEPQQKEEMMVESWQRIFNVTPVKSKWNNQGRYIQATFWELRKSMVVSVDYFVSR